MTNLKYLTRDILENKLIELDKKVFTDDKLNQMVIVDMILELNKR